MRAELITPSASAWQALLESCPHDVYHLPAYVAADAEREGAEPLALYVEGPGWRWLMPLLSRLIPSDISGGATSGTRDLVSPYGYPCPISSSYDADHFRAAIQVGLTALKSAGFVSLFVRLHPLVKLPLNAFTGVGAVVEHGPTISIDLTISDAEQWKQVRPRFRSSISKALREGQRLFIDEGRVHLDRFTSLYHETMKRQQSSAYYLFPASYFQRLAETLGPKLHLCVVEIAGDIACAGLFSEVCGTVQYLLSGTANEALSYSPLKTMLDHMRRWATSRGNREFHLGGGVGGTSDSLLYFKEGFSHRRHTFRSWRVVLDEHKYAQFGGTTGGPEGLGGFFPAYRRPK